MRKIKARTILSKRNVFNIYHGCSNNCLFCPNRSRLSGIKDFENTGAKTESLTLLDCALRAKRKKCMLHTGTLSDPYQKIESELELIRDCLDLILKKGFGITIMTKSGLVLRDIDLIEKINEKTKAVIILHMSTLKERVRELIEPHALSVEKRLEIIKKFTDRNIPTIVRLDPVLPFINDEVGTFEKLIDTLLGYNLTGSARRCIRK